jgi:plasmid maintenance system killer protein
MKLLKRAKSLTMHRQMAQILCLPKRYSIHVNGPWCITFEWKQGEALRVDLEQYH